MKYIKIILAILIIVSGIFTFKYLKTHKVREVKKPVKILPPIVKVIPLEKKNIRIEITATGTVAPIRESLIQPEVSGKIIYVSPHFLNGKIVNKGEILIKIDKDDYITALKRAEANYRRALLNYEKIKNQAERSIKEWNMEKKRFKFKNPSSLRLFKPQLKSAKADVESAKYQVELANRNIERTVIKAPFKGIIIDKKIDIGDIVSRGTVLSKIISIEKAEVVALIPDYEYPFIDFKNGKTEIILKLNRNIYKYSGTIDRSEKLVTPDTRMMKLYITVENPYKYLKISSKIPLFIGSFVKVKFYGKIFENITKIPVVALHNENEIWIAENKKLIIKKVNILKMDRNYAYISGNFKNGDLLITTNLPYISNGMSLRYFENPK